MKANISARGYTNVLLVLNMKRFVQAQDQNRFEKIRGKEEFAKVLRENWPQRLNNQDTFLSIQEDKRRRSHSEYMSTEDVGFATGVFRTLMLEKFAFPAYSLDAEKVKFDDDLLSNFQFKTLFLRNWNKWSIYVRPTFTGFFVIRLTNRHLDTPSSFTRLSQDILRLQESLDIQSAHKWLSRAREQYAHDPKTLAVKERSVKAFLAWLGADEAQPSSLLYYPLQWRLAMEVCGLFVEAVGSEMQVPGESDSIKLHVPKPSLSIPLHESYVVHHFTELLADCAVVKRSKAGNVNKNSQISISVNDIRESPQIRQALVSLMEGSLLKPYKEENPSDTTRLDHAFPVHRWSIVDQLLDHNQASWNDELCLLGSRTAIIMPAQKWHDYEVTVSSVPSSTLRVQYTRYWSAIERMIEFLIEIRVMAQLLESGSYDLLRDIAEKIHRTRFELFSGDIKIDGDLPDLVSSAASLRHQAALCQSLSHPQLWSRAEFAIDKADYLLEQFGVPQILEHIERNINSIVEFVNHIDELYLADLSEKSNDTSTILSLVLAAASFTLTLLMLPSFWADIWGMIPGQDQPQPFQIIVGGIGTFFAFVLLIFAVALIIPAWKQKQRLLSSLRKLYNGAK
ncbi:MAG TPA: hypothetical protein VN653_05405 [Anaerolineales bacterium]|nr:hypothetical protein [Anaerolineales bacterium]